MLSRFWGGTLLFAIISLSGLFAAGQPAPAQDKAHAPKVQWEYKVVRAGEDLTATEKLLNTLGAEGWELLFVTGGQPYIESSQTTPQINTTRNVVKFSPAIYHLKRQK